MLTPNTQGPDMEWTEDFQGVVFHGYTTEEVQSALSIQAPWTLYTTPDLIHGSSM